MKLTCDYCKNAPATHLLVVDMNSMVRVNHVSRLTNLVCSNCGHKGIEDCKRAPDIFMNPSLYMLTEIQIRNTGNDLVTEE